LRGGRGEKAPRDPLDCSSLPPARPYRCHPPEMTRCTPAIRHLPRPSGGFPKGQSLGSHRPPKPPILAATSCCTGACSGPVIQLPHKALNMNRRGRRQPIHRAKGERMAHALGQAMGSYPLDQVLRFHVGARPRIRSECPLSTSSIRVRYRFSPRATRLPSSWSAFARFSTILL